MSAVLKLLPLLALVAHIALWVVALTTLGGVSGPYPTKFDLAGQPIQYAEGGAWILPAVGLFVLVMAVFVVSVTRRLAQSRPAVVNVPLKRLFVTLSPEDRLVAVEPVSEMLYAIAFFTNLLLISITLDAYDIATGVGDSMPSWKLFAALGGLAILIGIFTIKTRRRILALTQRA